MKKLIGAVVLVAVLGVLLLAFIRGQKERASEAERERPVKTASRVSVQNNEPVISIDTPTQQKSGITTAALQATTHQDQQPAYAQVLEMHDWGDARSAYLTAKGENIKAVSAAEESRMDFERAKMLQKGSGVSTESVQDAEVKARATQASAQPAEASLRVLERSMHERWGDTLASWLTEGSTELDQLLDHRAVLIQLSLPASTSLRAAPKNATIRAADGNLISATLVSATTRIDPRFQGSTLFYLAPTETGGLDPGLATAALLPNGESRAGVIVPKEAVVWWQGRAWIYIQRDAERFARRELTTDSPVPGGWFVAEGISPDQRVVIKGAQQLLSEEFRAQIDVGQEQ